MDLFSQLAGAKGIFRLRDLDAHGIPHNYVYRLAERGELVRLARGAHQHASHEVTAHHTLAVAAQRPTRPPRRNLPPVSGFNNKCNETVFSMWLSIPQTHFFFIRIKPPTT